MYKTKDLKDNLLAGSMSSVNKTEFVEEISSEAIKATVTLTMGTKPTAADTITLGSRTYTWKDTVGTADGNVFIGASLATAQANFLSALTLSGVAGTDYGTLMTVNSDIKAAPFDGSDDSLITAITAGSVGNALASTENHVAVTNVFDTATLVGGLDPVLTIPIPAAGTYTLATLPPVGSGGEFIYVSDATNATALTGALAYSNGTVWIDVTDGAVVA
jgi:hypothetical protein